MISRPELVSHPPIGSDRESGCDIFKRHGLCEAVSGRVNRPKTLEQCARDSETVFGQFED